MTLTVAVCLTVLMAAASFALDLGMARVGVRDMQAVADLVALDQARLIDGRTTAELSADTKWTSGLAASVARNDDTFPASPGVTARLGTFEATTGVFTPTTAAQVPNAVEVTSSADMDHLLRPGGQTVSRSAVAMNEKTACFAVGSYAAQIKSNNSSLLTALVGERLDVGLVSYQGLLDLDVSLLALAAELGVGDVEGLADVENISVGDFYVAIAEVLRQDGNAVAASLLDGALRANVSSLPAIDLGGLITANNPDGALLDARMNVLDLVAGSAFLADGNTFVHVPALTVNLNPSGLSSTNLTLSGVKVIQKPVVNCGKIGTKANNSQIELTFGGTLASVSVPNPGTAVATVSGSITLKVSVAFAEGTLSVIDCKQGNISNPDKVTVDTYTRLLRPELELALSVKPALLAAVPLTASVTAAEQYTTTPVVVNLPPNVQHMDAGASHLEGATITLGTSSLAANILNEVVSSVVTPVAKAADSMINGSLRNVLGMDVASADVYAWPRPSCYASALVG